MKLDLFDKKILYELDVNARITTQQIAKKIKRSKQFVSFRIERLEKQGVLRGYNTVIDYERLGYMSLRVYFSFRKLSPTAQKELEQHLIKDPQVWWLVTLEGRWDVGYALAVKSITDFYSYWDSLMETYREYIAEYSVVIYTHIAQYPKSYLLEMKNEVNGTIVCAGAEPTKVDEFDMQILQHLANNGRASLHEIAQNMQTSPQVIKHHIQKLEKEKIILAYRALIDVSHLGYRYYKAYVTLLTTKRLTQMQEFCKTHPNMLNTNRSVGGCDFEIEIQARTFEEFDGFMKELREQFEGCVDKYEFVISREEKKMNYFPFGVE